MLALSVDILIHDYYGNEKNEGLSNTDYVTGGKKKIVIEAKQECRKTFGRVRFTHISIG